MTKLIGKSKSSNRRVSSGHTFLIITEGEKDEPNYFKALRDALKISALDVRILHPEGTDPVTLLNYAVQLRNQKEKEAQKGQGVPYDEVWVVCDLEKYKDERRISLKKAKNSEKAKNICFGESDPCFQYWLLLHFCFTTSPFDDCNVVIKNLREFFPKYQKNIVDYHEFLDSQKLQQAVSNAKRCRKHHETTGTEHPRTTIDLLIGNLNNSVPFHRRLF